MALIHHATLTPSKVELLAGWLPARPWYRNKHDAPALEKSDGFRLDDPEGEVGIEFMVATGTRAPSGRPSCYRSLIARRCWRAPNTPSSERCSTARWADAGCTTAATTPYSSPNCWR
jgi:hypothetical protein